MKFILFCVALDLFDDLTEMRIMKNSIIQNFDKSFIVDSWEFLHAWDRY